MNVLAGGRATAQEAVADAHHTKTAEDDAVLSRRVTLNVDHVTLRAAITALAAQIPTPIGYQREWLDATGRVVTMHAVQQPLSSVLSQLLVGTNLRFLVASGTIALRQVDAEAAQGVIAGVVVDGRTKQPLRGTNVTLDDSVTTVRTNETGHYRFASVSSGPHRVTVRALGYARQTKIVTVSDDATAAADFALSTSVNTLDQVVVTATGAQRYRELGHVVGTIHDVDSLVREAPISSLSELLTARIPGLSVLPGNGGVVGGDVALRLRGQTTAWLDPQPIVVVDGIRYRNTAKTANVDDSERRPYGAEPRSPLNDLNVNDIESVEVVKGPSASTLYGPDAANGVIVIKTKHGVPGAAKWNVYAYPDLASQPKTDATQASGYRAWGHDPNSGELFNQNCTLLFQVADNQQCVLDSITVVRTVVNDPQFSVLAKDRPQWHSGANVRGGAPALTYFFSGNYDSEIGSLQISPLIAQAIESMMGTKSLGDALRNPNTQKTLSLHSNISTELTPKATVNFVVDYTQATQRAVTVSSVWNALSSLEPLPPGADTTPSGLLALQDPATVNAFFRTTTDQMHRLVSAVSATWQPIPWLTAAANGGVDLSTDIDQLLVPAGTLSVDDGGEADDWRKQNTQRSADVRMTAIAHPAMFSLRSSAGVQYTYLNLDGLQTVGTNLAPGSSSISTAQNTGLGKLWAETANLGFYGEEVVGWRDRLFVTGSLRFDGSSTFGDAYKARPFPKMGVSWIVSDEPLFQRLSLPGIDEVRFRYSFGSSSRYPTSAYKYGNEYYYPGTINGESVSLVNRDVLANPMIRPERTRESEWGADLTLVRQLRLELTWYRRRTNDQINTLSVPYGFDRQWANVGDLAAHGFELRADANVFETPRVSFDVHASYAYNTNKVLSLGSAAETISRFGSIAVGYPLGAAMGTAIASFADTAGGNADHIIESSEVSVTDPKYLGVIYPPNVYTLTPVVSLFGSRVRVSALFDRQTGGIQISPFGPYCGDRGTCVAQYLTTTPLATQANLLGVADASYFASSDFTRWRELSVTGDCPSSIRQRLGLSRASASIQVRNLALWTKYRGPDPESVPGLGTLGLNSAIDGATGIPQVRSVTFRFDLTP